MLVSAKIIRKPRRPRVCDTCENVIIGPVLRLYGCADRPDPLTVLYLHPHADCSQWNHPKILAARAALAVRPSTETDR